MKITNDFTKEYCLHLSEEEIIKIDAIHDETIKAFAQEIQHAAQWIRDKKTIFTKEVFAE